MLCTKKTQAINFANLVGLVVAFFLAFPAQAKRLISLDPATTELLIALDLDKYLVGIDKDSKNLKLSSKPVVTSSHTILNFEKIVSLKPDHVLGHDLGFLDLEPQFERFQISHSLLPNQEIQDLKKNLASLAKKFKREERLKQMALDFKISSSKRFKDKTFVFIVGYDPLFVAGRENFINEALTKCGLSNKVESNDFVRWDRENFSKESPDFLFVVDTIDLKRLSQDLGSWLSNTEVISLNADSWSRLSLKFLEAARELCE